jgi:hypothetical protein
MEGSGQIITNLNPGGTKTYDFYGSGTWFFRNVFTDGRCNFNPKK